MKVLPRRCEAYEKEEGCPPPCISCHEDEDEYNYALLGGTDAQTKEEIEVCCVVHTWLETTGRLL